MLNDDLADDFRCSPDPSAHRDGRCGERTADRGPSSSEGYIDLLYRDDSGLVVVDYKTAAAVSGESLAAYETQLSVYAKAVEDAVGEPVARCVLLFLRPERAIQHSLRPGTPTPP